MDEKGIDFSLLSKSEYSFELQLEILQLDPTELLPPVLDLGCGPSATLVHHLRGLGIDAIGVDKNAPEDGGELPLVRGDWLTYPVAQRRWGTVISHMGLSNSFLHHHLRPDGHPERYALRFMELLGALEPKGRLVYAPGMPFLEEHLPREAYSVAHFPVPELQRGPLDDALELRLGANVLYACHVTKLC